MAAKAAEKASLAAKAAEDARIAAERVERAKAEAKEAEDRAAAEAAEEARLAMIAAQEAEEAKEAERAAAARAIEEAKAAKAAAEAAALKKAEEEAAARAAERARLDAIAAAEAARRKKAEEEKAARAAERAHKEAEEEAAREGLTLGELKIATKKKPKCKKFTKELWKKLMDKAKEMAKEERKKKYAENRMGGIIDIMKRKVQKRKKEEQEAADRAQREADEAGKAAARARTEEERNKALEVKKAAEAEAKRALAAVQELERQLAEAERKMAEDESRKDEFEDKMFDEKQQRAIMRAEIAKAEKRRAKRQARSQSQSFVPRATCEYNTDNFHRRTLSVDERSRMDAVVEKRLSERHRGGRVGGGMNKVGKRGSMGGDDDEGDEVAKLKEEQRQQQKARIEAKAAKEKQKKNMASDIEKMKAELAAKKAEAEKFNSSIQQAMAQSSSMLNVDGAGSRFTSRAGSRVPSPFGSRAGSRRTSVDMSAPMYPKKAALPLAMKAAQQAKDAAAEAEKDMKKAQGAESDAYKKVEEHAKMRMTAYEEARAAAEAAKEAAAAKFAEEERSKMLSREQRWAESRAANAAMWKEERVKDFRHVTMASEEASRRLRTAEEKKSEAEAKDQSYRRSWTNIGRTTEIGSTSHLIFIDMKKRREEEVKSGKPKESSAPKRPNRDPALLSPRKRNPDEPPSPVKENLQTLRTQHGYPAKKMDRTLSVGGLERINSEFSESDRLREEARTNMSSFNDTMESARQLTGGARRAVSTSDVSRDGADTDMVPSYKNRWFSQSAFVPPNHLVGENQSILDLQKRTASSTVSAKSSLYKYYGRY